MNRITTYLSAGALAIVAVGASGAQAGLTVFTDRGAWNAAVAGATTIDFDHLSQGVSNNTLTQSTASATVIFSDPGAALAVAGGFGLTQSGSNVLQSSFDSAAPHFHIALSPPPGGSVVNAVAFDFNADFDLPTITLALGSGGSASKASVGAPNLAFLGVISTDGFSTLDITQDIQSFNDFINIDNFSFGTAAAAVVEPDTLAVFGAALTGFGVFRRRKPKIG